MAPIKLDSCKLLGFRIVDERQARMEIGAKIGQQKTQVGGVSILPRQHKLGGKISEQKE